MAQLNDFMTRIDLSVLNDYVAANGKSVVYAKGERIVQQGRLCRYVGVVKSGYFKYVALNSMGQEVVTGQPFGLSLRRVSSVYAALSVFGEE